jgi:hypothetical protein
VPGGGRHLGNGPIPADYYGDEMLAYYVKDGPRPHSSGRGYELSQSAPGKGEPRLVTPTDLQARLEDRKVRYLGKDPPEFNTNSPSQFSQRVVIEISCHDSICRIFDKAGFFLIENLKPEDAAATIFKGLTMSGQL